MTPKDFTAARGAAETTFSTNYAELKANYSSALLAAKAETDRAKQCVLIRSALDANNRLTTLVADFLRLGNEGGCTLTPAKARDLRADIEKYKTQYSEIKHGRDKIHSLEMAYADADTRAIHADGVNLFYFALIGLGLVAIVFLVIGSGIRRAFNAQPVAPIVPRGFA